MFIHGAGSRLDRRLDEGNIRILPLVAYDLEGVRSLLASWTLTFQIVLPENGRHPSIVVLPLRGDYWYPRGLGD